MIGVVTTTDAAISAPQSIEAYPMKSKIATGRVLVAALERTSANMKLFHEKMNDRIVAVAMPGTDSGSVIRKNAPIAVRPSTCADSSSSSGIWSKNDIMMYRISGSETNMCDSTSGRYSPVIFSWAKMKYHGTSRLTPGMMRAISTTIADLFMTKRLIAYAAGTASTSESAVAMNATKNEFQM